MLVEVGDYTLTNNKCFMCIITHNNVNPHGAVPANVYEANAKLPTGILKYYGLENWLCCVSQELFVNVSTYAEVIKQEKLQNAAV